jgi:serine/threonine-protein kinase HipA
MLLAEVRLWGKRIGAVSWDSNRQCANFEYAPAFVGSGIEVAPLTMPLLRTVYSFPNLPAATFKGLPGLLADSLPDDFGNALIDAWLARQGRSAASFTPIERLCYTGARGMGALEYLPALAGRESPGEALDLQALVQLASDILRKRTQMDGHFTAPDSENTLNHILRIGTSAGGARAKAVIAWHPHTHAVRSGQVQAGDGFEYWLLKFDGVSGNRDKELDDPQGYGLIEYAYFLMARAAGIEMSECRLLEEGNRRHFMTRRFDRTPGGAKLHMQTLGALAHVDYRQPGAHSYEQALLILRQLALPMASIEQLFRRMAFNVIARNQDDHVKNIAFLMDRAGQWSLAPAYDVTYSYNPQGAWTGQHQMTLNGKHDGFDMADFIACARTCSMKKGRAEAIVDDVRNAVLRWEEFATAAGVAEPVQRQIQQAHRLTLGTHAPALASATAPVQMELTL